jgi:hypothetical protein
MIATEEIGGYFAEGPISDEEISQQGKEIQAHEMELVETRSGIGWKFANQGMFRTHDDSMF